MSLLLYRVLAASGGYVNGAEVAIGSLVALTAEEARYERDAGTIEATGIAPVEPPAPPVIQPGDLVQTVRGRFSRSVDVATLETFMARQGGTISTYLTRRANEIGVGVTGAVAGQLAGLIGGADAQHDTLGKLAALVVGLSGEVGLKASRADLTGAVDRLLDGAGPAYDTFRELRDLIVGDETALSGLATLVAGKADAASTSAGLDTLTRKLRGQATLYLSYAAFGDSIVAGYAASTPALRWVSRLGTYLGVVPTNYGVSGSQIADQQPSIYAQSVSHTAAQLYTLEIGTNEGYFYGPEVKRQQTFLAMHMAALAWLAMPERTKVRGRRAASVASIFALTSNGAGDVNTVATATTTSAHGFVTGQAVTISGAAQAAYNVTAPVTVTGPTSFTFPIFGLPASPATGGAIRATGPGIVYAGAWVADDTVLGGGLSMRASTVGATATFRTFGPVAYLAYGMATGNGGSFSVTVDGVAYGTFTSNGILAGFATTGVIGSTHGSGLARLTGLTNAPHTIVVTVTSATGAGDVWIDWVSGLGTPAGATYLAGPTVVAGGAPQQGNGFYPAQLYASLAQTSVGTLAADGLNVLYADVPGAMNAGTDLISDNTHPNDTGMLHIAEAYISALNTASSGRAKSAFLAAQQALGGPWSDGSDGATRTTKRVAIGTVDAGYTFHVGGSTLLRGLLDFDGSYPLRWGNTSIAGANTGGVTLTANGAVALTVQYDGKTIVGQASITQAGLVTATAAALSGPVDFSGAFPLRWGNTSIAGANTGGVTITANGAVALTVQYDGKTIVGQASITQAGLVTATAAALSGPVDFSGAFPLRWGNTSIAGANTGGVTLTANGAVALTVQYDGKTIVGQASITQAGLVTATAAALSGPVDFSGAFPLRWGNTSIAGANAGGVTVTANGAVALTVQYDGKLGVHLLGAAPTAYMDIATDATASPVGINVRPSTHATSRRAQINFGSYQLLQDLSLNGALDGCLYSGASNSAVLYWSAAGKVKTLPGLSVGMADAGYTFQVGGSALLQGLLDFSGAFPLRWGNTSVVGQDTGGVTVTANGAVAMTVRYDGNVGIGNTAPGTKLTVAGPVGLGVYTVATLPSPGIAGRVAGCSNARVSGEASGAGTGGLVYDTGSAWRVAGTNITAVA